MIKNNLIAEFESIIDDLIDSTPIPELEDRYKIIERLNEEFFQKTNGSNLPPHLLHKLTDWVLIEVLTDKDVDKVTNTDFAILSPRQIKRRIKRECSVLSEVMDFLDLKYVKQQDSLAKTLKKTDHE